MSHIFISYSRRDIDFAQKMVDALAENDLDIWIDWKSVPKSEDWEQGDLSRYRRGRCLPVPDQPGFCIIRNVQQGDCTRDQERQADPPHCFTRY